MRALSLGQQVLGHREAAGLTQEQLGVKAGYGAGAGVSISRIETGKVIPTQANIGKIADALDLSSEEHEKLQELRSQAASGVAVTPDAPVRKLNLRARKEHLETRMASHVRKMEGIAERNQAAIEDASEKFFLRLAAVAEEIQAAPIEELLELKNPAPRVRNPAPLDLAKRQLDALTLRLVDSFAGVAGKGAVASLIGALGGASLTGLDAYASYVTVARFGTASTGTPNAQLHGIALKNSTLATIGGGTLENGGGGVNGGQRAIIANVAAGAVTGLLNAAAMYTAKTLIERQTIARQLEKAKSDLDAAEERFPEWAEAVSRGTDLLEYIAIHASHSLEKWANSLGDLPLAWQNLSTTQRRQFREMIAIAACEVAIDLTPTEDIMTVSAEKLQATITDVDARFTLAELMIKSLV